MTLEFLQRMAINHEYGELKLIETTKLHKQLLVLRKNKYRYK
jgi:hypothetical protein